MWLKCVILFILSLWWIVCAEFFEDLTADNQEMLRIKYNEGQRFIFFPDPKGNIHIIDLNKTTTENNRFVPKLDVFAVVYSSKNPAKPIVISSENRSLLFENDLVDLTKPFKVLVHGWRDDRYGDMALDIKDAYIDNVKDVNVMVIDWGHGASGHYAIACSNAARTGEYLSNFLMWLIKKGIPVENFHLIGHSLGAHVTGIAGRYVTSGKIPYITGLDPALPLWDKYSKRIKHTDAKYVEVIHTNIGLFGIDDPLGSNDFYPNGGTHQPGCGFIGFGCSHNRAFQYFASSIDNTKFKAVQCGHLRELIGKSCSNLSTLHMGGSAPKPAVGIFYLQTKKRPPYYLE